MPAKPDAPNPVHHAPRDPVLVRARFAVAMCVAAGAMALAATGAAAQADAPTGIQPDAGVLSLATWLDWERVGDAHLSPDGRQVVYTRGWVDRVEDRWESSIWIVGSDGTRNRHLIDGSSPRWSPSGDRLAFIARDDDGNSQVFVRWMDAEGAVSQITRVTASPSDLEWSPDGALLSFTMPVPAEAPASKLWSIDLPDRPEGAKWTPAPRIVEGLVYRGDRRGFLDETFDQVFVVPADGGTPRQLTRGNYDHGGAVWEPGGRTLLLSGLLVEEAGYRWMESEIYRIDVATGRTEAVTRRQGPDRRPVPSPDGRYVAYVGHDSTTLDYIESSLYVMNADGSQSRSLTADLDRSPGQLFWAADSRGVYFNVSADGYASLYYAPLDSNGAVRRVTDGPELLSLHDLGADGRAVAQLETAHEPGDLVVFDVRRPEQRTRITDVNADVLHGVRLGEVEEIWTESSLDGLPIHGWIIKPPDFDPDRRYPLMLVIHGGPHSMYNGGFNFGWQEHAANGYVVLYTNPRGSSGYGTEFGNAIQYDYPNNDFHDLMSSVDNVVSRGYVDEANMFVYGCSGGGVLTAWVVSHTDRFRAASANCPVTNWLSFVGQVDGNYLRWYADFEHYPWEDPSEHLRRSPLMYVDQVNTPTMLMTGVLDMRTPISQTEQFYQALKVLRKPTAMIRFENEWHGTSSRPSNFLRTQLYLRKWFERWGDHDDDRSITDQG